MHSRWLRAGALSGALAFGTVGILVVARGQSNEQPAPRAPGGELPVVRAELTFAPNVPPPITRRYPARVVVDLEVQERVLQIAEGVSYTFWTYGGEVPGKFIRVRKGDTVEFHLKNHPSSKMPHNIDLHAVTGPGGGAASSFTAPGHESVFTFKVLNEGLYVYHCATAPVGMHIANGMYGLILVEPEYGLPPVDREYYVMQGDFYTEGEYHEPGLQAFDMRKAIAEHATYVLFNGAEGALLGDKALKAKVGERVRLFVGNGGPNLVSSFHVIGEIFDRVHPEGGTRVQENVQTTLIPAGGSAIVEYTCEVPGNYPLVDHSIFRTFNKGALGMMVIEGLQDTNVYTGKQLDRTYQPTGAVGVAQPAVATGPAPGSFEARMAGGREVFTTVCAACHQPTGQGIPAVFPPLAGSDFLMADKTRSIGVVIKGLSGKVTVNGQQYDSIMPGLPHLSDAQVADVLTFVRNSWGNKGEPVSPAEVAAVRNGH